MTDDVQEVTGCKIEMRTAVSPTLVLQRYDEGTGKIVATWDELRLKAKGQWSQIIISLNMAGVFPIYEEDRLFDTEEHISWLSWEEPHVTFQTKV